MMLTFFGATAQQVDLDRITPPLWDKIVDDPNELVPVYILLKDQVDIQGMRIQFINNNTPVKERAIRVVTSLKAKAAATQQPLIDLLLAQPIIDRHSIQPYWVTNVIYARITSATVRLLSTHPDVAMLELVMPVSYADDGIATAAPPVPNGREPGLTQMKADKLWQMGYTGAGRIVMTVDSGVEWLHPSLTGKYQGIYFSEGQSYTGAAIEGPTDCDGHGTRVTGNMVGLDRITNDTIGVAFNARWIAGPHSGLIDACDDANVQEIANFQFALDPDNNSSTTNDIPDVVNNSWGSNGGCFNNNTTSNSQNAMVAAGISVVWAAGNDGPGAMTVNSQGAINLDLVNSFSVGSVRLNDAISGFSSRGPSQCNGTGPIDIKPEVVAHGEGVRSCDLNGNYSTQNGTSFAAPYVAGAVALLKEAFPTLSGEEINLALYLSARDLGPAGEDNSYGNGLVDCLEAFNYLVAQGNNPVNPVVSRDAIAVELNDEEQICGDGTYSALFTFENGGESNMTDVIINVEYSKNGNILVTEAINWTGNLDTGERATVAIPERSDLRGGVRITATLNNPNGGIDFKPYNNRLEKPVEIISAPEVITDRVGPVDVEPCAGAPAILTVASENAVNARWYINNSSSGPVIGEGLVIESPELPSPFTFFVEVDYASQGGIPNIDNSSVEYDEFFGGIVFDVLAPAKIKTTKIYATSSGINLFQIRNAQNTVMKNLSLTLNEGENTLNWNVDLPKGLNYRMLRSAGGDIAFTPGAEANYPYAVGGAIFMNRGIRNEDDYEFFYDWDITYTSPCGRSAIDVQFNNSSAGITPGFDVSATPSVNVPVSFTNTGTTASGYYWDFGNGQTSTEENPSVTYTETGEYMVTQSLITDAGCSVSTFELITVELNVANRELEAEQFIEVFPNPTTGMLAVQFSFAESSKVGIQVSDVAGKLLRNDAPVLYRDNRIQLDLQDFQNGVYYLLFQLEEGTVVRRIVKINQ